MLGFIITVTLVYFIYYVMHIRKYDKDGKYIQKKNKSEEPKIPVEVELLIRKYNIDLKKLNYRGLLKVVGLVCALDVAIIVTLIIYLPIKSLMIKLLIGGLLTFPVILISYSLLGKYFKQKGLIKNDRNKQNNRK